MKRSQLLAVVAVGAVVVVAAAWWLRPHDPFRQANALLARGDVHAAQLVMRSTVLNHPNDAHAHYMLAAVELRSGDAAGAEREAREAARRGYDPAAVAVVLAQATVQQQRYAEVLQTYQPTAAMSPAQAATIEVQRGLAQFGLGHPQEAAAAIAEAQRRDPHSYDADMASAQLARARNDLAGAAQAVDQALQVVPTSPPALLMRADLLNMQNDRARALSAYDAAVAHPGGSNIPLLARADLLSVMGQSARARADLDAVLKTQPVNPIANFLLARLLIQAAQWPAADAALTKAQPIIDKVPRGLYLVAIVKSSIGQPQQALDAASDYLAKAPASDRLAAARLLGELSLRNKDPARAVAALEPMAAAGQADVPLLRVLATAYQQTGNQPGAVRALEQASRLAPNDSAVLTQLASARIGAGDLRAATADLQQALDHDTVPALGPATLAAGVPAAGPTPADTATALVLTAIQAGDPDGASAALDRLRAMKGADPARVGLLTGIVRLAHFDLAGAAAELDAQVKAHPDDVTARVELARVAALRGDRPGGERMLAAIADKDPANAVMLSSLIPLLVQDGQADAAIMRMQAAHKAEPANAQITLALAQLLGRNGHPRDALALLGGVGAAVAPAELLQLKAGWQAQAGDRAAAAESLRQAVALAPNDPAVAESLIRVKLVDGDLAGANAVAQAALAANPGNPALLASLVGIANRQGGTPAGLAMADRLAADTANGAAALPLKGDLLLALRRVPDAQAAYEAAFASAPSAMLLTRIASAEQAQGRNDAAASRLRDWMGQHPDDAPVAAMLGSLDLANKRVAQARGELQVVLGQHPDDATTLNNMALADQQLGDLTQARDLAQRAYLLQPSPQTADTLGWIILGQNDAANALPLLRQASEGLRNDPGVQYHYAAALQKNGRAADAAAILRPVVAQGAPFDDKPAAQRLLASLPPG